MKNTLGFLFVLLTLSFSHFVYADGEISDCGPISEPGAYTLTQDIGEGGTCITVEVEGVTIYGASNTITGDVIGANGIDDTTVGSSISIDNTTIIGNVIAGNGGINATGGSVSLTNTTVTGSVIGGNGANGGSIVMQYSTASTITAGGNENISGSVDIYGNTINLSDTTINIYDNDDYNDSSIHITSYNHLPIITNESTTINTLNGYLYLNDDEIGPWDGVFNPYFDKTIYDIDQCNRLLLPGIYQLGNDIMGDCLIQREGIEIDGNSHIFTGNITSSDGYKGPGVSIKLHNITVTNNITSGNGGMSDFGYNIFSGGLITITNGNILGNITSGDGYSDGSNNNSNNDTGKSNGGNIIIDNSTLGYITITSGKGGDTYNKNPGNGGNITIISGASIDLSNKEINSGLGGVDECDGFNCGGQGQNGVVNLIYSGSPNSLITNENTYINGTSNLIINDISLGVWDGLFTKNRIDNTSSVALDKKYLNNNDLILNQNADISHIITPLSQLTILGDFGSTISWISSNSSVLSNDGQIVNRPSFENGNANVTLTATITKEDVTDTLVFNLIIIKSSVTQSINTGPTSEKFLSDIADGLITIEGGNPLLTPKVTIDVTYTIQAGDTSVVFPAGTEITKQGGGNIDFTQFNIIDTTLLTRESLTGTIGSIKIGIPNLGLLFSTPISLSIPVDEKYNGQIVDVYYQSEGSTEWNTETTCTISNALCIFTTNHATTFAVKKEVTSSRSSSSGSYIPNLAIATITNTPVVTPIITTPNTIGRIIKLKFPRMQGNDIKEIQSYLNTKLKLKLIVDGIYGIQSKLAVISFQKLNNLKQDGIIGPITRSLLK